MLITLIIILIALAALGYGGLVAFQYYHWRQMQRFTRETAVKLARRHGKDQAIHYLKGKPSTFAQFVNQQVVHTAYDKWETEILEKTLTIRKEKGLAAAKYFRRQLPRTKADWADEVEKR